MNKTAIAVTGVALGAGTMYFLDPAGGRRRRARLGETVTHASHRARTVGGAAARNARHRLTGVVARTVGRVAPAVPLSDEVLAARVRARLGRLVSHPGAIDVAAAAGTVTLTGAVFAAEVDQLSAGVADVAGVTGVENRLEPHVDASHVSSLQGAGPRMVPVQQSTSRSSHDARSRTRPRSPDGTGRRSPLCTCGPSYRSSSARPAAACFRRRRR